MGVACFSQRGPDFHSSVPKVSQKGSWQESARGWWPWAGHSAGGHRRKSDCCPSCDHDSPQGTFLLALFFFFFPVWEILVKALTSENRSDSFYCFLLMVHGLAITGTMIDRDILSSGMDVIGHSGSPLPRKHIGFVTINVFLKEHYRRHHFRLFEYCCRKSAIYRWKPWKKIKVMRVLAIFTTHPLQEIITVCPHAVEDR